GKFFGVLGTDFQAVAAVDAVILHDVGLLILHGNRLHLTVPHTFITMAAACIFKIYNSHFCPPPAMLSLIFMHIISFPAQAGQRKKAEISPYTGLVFI